MNVQEQIAQLQRQLNDIAKQLAVLQRIDVNPPVANAVQYSGTPVVGQLTQWTGAGTVTGAGYAGSVVLLADGSRALSSDWDIGSGRRVLAAGVRARGTADFRLENSSGNLGLLVSSSGQVRVGETTAATQMVVRGSNTNTDTAFGGAMGLTQQNNSATNGNYTTYFNLNSAGSVNAGLYFVNIDHAYAGAIDFVTRSTAGSFGVAMRVDQFRNVGIGTGTTAPRGKLDVDQFSTTAAIPVLVLDQADVSEEMIRFVASVGTGNPIQTSALGTYYGKVRVWVEGVGEKWLPLYNP